MIVVAALYSAPSNAQNSTRMIEVAGGETLALGSWAMTLPDANVYACASAADLARYYAILAHNLASLHNSDPVLPKPSGCTTIEAGAEVQLMDATGDSVCLHQHDQSASTCLWAKKIAVESKATYNHDQQETKSINEQFNRVFDRQHPECKEWRTNKHLPDHCY